MKTDEIIKAGIVGGVLIIIIEFLVGIASPGVVYGFSLIAMLIGGAVSGWMVKGKNEDAAVAGALAGLIYIIIGVLIIFPLVSSYHTSNAIAAIIIGIVLGAIGGVVGNYIASSQAGSKKPSGRKR